MEPYQKTIPIREMIEWLLSRRISKDHDGNICYVQSQNGNLSTEFKPLLKDIGELEWANEYFGRVTKNTLISGESPDASNIWIGNEESTTSLHLDHYENLYCQVIGSKTFYLIPPSEYPCLKGK